jgi:hypothetical protein
MPAKRVNPNTVKLHYSYSVPELARCCGVHKNTVRNWQADGLEPIDKARPVLFQGATVRNFLRQRNASRTCPSAPGMLYCMRCRQSRRPALGMVEYVALRPTSGNLRALCEVCEATMYRAARKADLAKVMPGIDVQMAQGKPRLTGRT